MASAGGLTTCVCVIHVLALKCKQQCAYELNSVYLFWTGRVISEPNDLIRPDSKSGQDVKSLERCAKPKCVFFLPGGMDGLRQMFNPLLSDGLVTLNAERENGNYSS